MITPKMLELAVSAGDSDSLDNVASVISKHGITNVVTNADAQDDLYRQLMPLMNQYDSDYEDRAGLLLKSIRLHYKDSPEHLFASILTIQKFINLDDLATHSMLYSDVMNYPQPTVLLEAWAGFSYRFSAPAGASINETRLFSKYKDGITALNLFDIYDLVDNIDRGCGIPDTPITALAWHLYNADQEKYLKILSTKEDYFEIRTLLDRLDDQQKLIVAIETNNKLAKIECIRKIVYFRNNCTYLPDSIYQQLSKAIISVANADENLFAQFLEYFLKYPVRSPFLFPALGMAISQLSEKLRQMVVKAIPIELEHSDAVLYGLFTQNMKLAAPNNIVLAVTKSINEKRQLFLKEIKSPSINEMKLTNVVNVVIEYLTTSSPNVLFEFLALAVKQLNEESIQWHRTETEMNAKLWLALSEINVSSLAFEASDIKEVDGQYLPILASLDAAVGLPLVMTLLQHTDLSDLMAVINDIRKRFSLGSICIPTSKSPANIGVDTAAAHDATQEMP